MTRLSKTVVPSGETRVTEFRGARGSNTGDDFHELWATRQAIRLLLNDDDLQAIAVEGLAAQDEAAKLESTWDGVDCTLYFGGQTAATAQNIVLEQLKYSAAAPAAAWTVGRLVSGTRRDQSVIAKLAKAWKGLAELRREKTPPTVSLISNQPVDQEVIEAFARASTSPRAMPKRKPPGSASAEIRFAYAAGLNENDFHAFSSAIRFEGGAGSRFALEEQVLQAIADWTDQDVQRVVTGLRQFVRQRMRPEFTGELITRESVMLHLGASEDVALFPCPSEITNTATPVNRAPVSEAIQQLLSGEQHLCLHGRGGVGKTTAIQEIEVALPSGSIMIKYDCYGGGRYLDSNALRHRPTDAFVQVTNELAARLKLPLLLSRHMGSDYPRLFSNRLKHAASALAAQQPNALIVIAIDAADNAVAAAEGRVPAEPVFIHDFMLLGGIPENVRFVVTARTGRLAKLRLPSSYRRIEILPFSRPETGENVSHHWNAPEPWVDDFHHLSSGVPRVQAYAFAVEGAPPSTALDRLRPAGKSLDEVFRQQFNEARRKSGNSAEVSRLCAGLIALPRPVPLLDLAAVLQSSEAQLVDLCVDLAPGIRLHDGAISFADEDFEHFVRSKGADQLGNVQQATASWLLSRAAHDRYAALNVAAALVIAGRGSELLELVERESAPNAIADPVLRREAELQRLRLAIKVCREAGDVPRALRFVLIGAEGLKTEAALRDLLVCNPDLAANFAQETAGRLILSDPELIQDHGPLLFQKLSVDADRGDPVSVREGRRLLRAWLQARRDRSSSPENQHSHTWSISISDISSAVEATFKTEGLAKSLVELESWKPRRIALEVALSLPPRLIAEGCADDLEAATLDRLGPIGQVFILIPLALAGRSVNTELLSRGLAKLLRYRLKIQSFFYGQHAHSSAHALLLDTALTACEILTSKGVATALVDRLLNSFLSPELRSIERHYPHETTKLDLLFRAYTLKETRAGRIPISKDIFEPRPKSTDEEKRRYAANGDEEHDRSLMEVTESVFGIYAAVADALVNRKPDTELHDSLRRAINVLKREAWRISRRRGSDSIRGLAAKSLLVLLADDYDSLALKQFAMEVNGHWRDSYEVPNDQLVARLSLRPELHDSLLTELATAADAIREMRIGANEKSRTLVSYARLIKPISKHDANAIFNNAVEAASELDQEVMAQIRLLDKLIIRGVETFPDARSTVQKVANVVADAAIRLDGYEHFPWDESMSALATLDTPLALANAARWDDESIVPLNDSLAPLLKIALKKGSIRPTQAGALDLFLDRNHRVLDDVLEQADVAKLGSLPDLAEEAAYDSLVRYGQRRNDVLKHFIERQGFDGRWTGRLCRQECFLSQLPSETPSDGHNEPISTEKNGELFTRHMWEHNTLLDSGQLLVAISALEDQARAEHSYLPVSVILSQARSKVLPRDRVTHLAALAELDGLTITDEAAKALLQAIDAWWGNPAVKSWCQMNLPDVLVKRLPELSRYLPYGQDNLTPALELTGLCEAERQELILRGIEGHVDEFESEQIFALAGRVGDQLAPPDAAALADWYAERLANRIPKEDQDQRAPESVLPRDADEAVARFVFAYMGDYDLRMRWRAAHALRRLARVYDTATLTALIAQYGRREEVVFRGGQFAFYWLAARLWFVLAWDRVAEERPDIARHAGPTLLQIALDETFPHVLVRSFARDACDKLAAAGLLSLNPDAKIGLQHVNETPLPRSPTSKSIEREFSVNDESRRFKFDWMDTLPYWYQPLLRAFANLDCEHFLKEVEHWIIDVWGYDGDIRDRDNERRRGLNGDRDWMLSSHRHGSTPTLERLNNHLEWHAMWCATGELLKTEPLISHDDDDWESWNDLGAQIRREKLSEPPLWSADLLGPIPLIARNWQADSRPINEWVLAVVEADHRAEMFPSDETEYVVVDGYTERRMSDRTETISVSSALAAPDTSSSLLRALQTMEDSWDYKLPDEGEDNEIDKDPYRLLGWLRSNHRDIRIDEKDPLRAYASIITASPGCLVSEACNLTSDQTWHARWSNEMAHALMFKYETWGEEAKDDDRYMSDLTVAGHRLLARKEQLQEFLHSHGLDLIIEVEVTRRGRENRRLIGEEERETSEGRFDRLYKLQSGGALEVAEGCLGSWTGNCTRT